MPRHNRAAAPIVAGLAAMLVGAWGPWVAHANAVMALGALDLAEFVKFMQRAGLTGVVREWFCLPLVAAAAGLALWTRRIRGLGFRFQIASVLGMALVTLSVLPPYPDLLRAHRSPQDRLFLAMGVGALVLTLVMGGVGNRLTQRTAAALAIILVTGSLAPAIWQFVQLSAPLASLYGAPIHPGWGLIMTVAGSLSAATGATVMLAE